MATATNTDAKRSWCLVDVAYPFEGQRHIEGPLTGPEHPFASPPLCDEPQRSRPTRAAYRMPR